MLTVHFLHKHGNMTIKVVYPSTGSEGEDTKDVYYNPPQSAIENFSSHDMCIVLTDAKTTIASSSCDMMSQPYIKGNTYVGPVTNDNGEYLLFFAAILTSALEIHGIHANTSIIGTETAVTVPPGRQLITSLSLIAGSHA